MLSQAAIHMYIRYSFDCQWGISLKAEKPKKNVSNISAISTKQQRALSTFKKNPRWGYMITSKLQIPDHQSVQSTCKKPVVSDLKWYPVCAHRSPKFTSPNSSNGCCCSDGSGSLVRRTVETALKMSNHWVHGDFSWDIWKCFVYNCIYLSCGIWIMRWWFPNGFWDIVPHILCKQWGG